MARAVAELPPKLRAVVVLKDVYGLPHEAIAEELGISVSAAKVRLHRGRRRLRDALVRGDEVVPCGLRTSPTSCPGSSTARCGSTRRTQAFIESDLRCQAELARYRKLLRTLEQLRTRYLEPSPGLLAATLTALAEEGERRVVHSIITGRRLAYAGAALGGAVAAGAAATARGPGPLPPPSLAG